MSLLHGVLVQVFLRLYTLRNQAFHGGATYGTGRGRKQIKHGSFIMAKITLQNLGTIVRRKRGNQGLRATAAEIGTSAPTRSRIESGKMPDLQTFGKICRWLEIDPGTLLGMEFRPPEESQPETATAHLKAKREIEPRTARALANAIVRAQQMLADAPGEPYGERL